MTSEQADWNVRDALKHIKSGKAAVFSVGGHAPYAKAHYDSKKELS